ncbi:MAG: hypothetical protein ACO1SV_27090 [Fimbriimonas sp.]
MSRFNRALDELRRERMDDGLDTARSAFGAARIVRVRNTRVLVALGAAGIAAVLTLVPRAPAVASMSLAQAVSEAAERAPRSHTRWYGIDPMKTESITMEQWHDGVRMRNDFLRLKGMEDAEIQHAFDGKRKWSRYPRRRYVSVQDSEGFGNQVGGETLPELARSLRSGNKRIEVRTIQVDGKPMLELVNDWTWNPPGSRPNRGRTVWLADPERKLPREVRSYNMQGQKWVQVGSATFDYPTEPLPEELFQLIPKAGETLFDKDEERRKLPALWAKPLGTQKVRGEEIALRDVVLDRYATLAVIWTGGPLLPPNSRVVVTDSTGRRTVGIPYLAYRDSKENKHPTSALRKIEGKPNRMTMLHGLKGTVAMPLKIEIPIGKEKAVFTVRRLRHTDQLMDLTVTLGANDPSFRPARAIAVTR